MPEDTTPEDESEFAKNARAAMEENARLKRESALLRAGLDPDSTEGQMVQKLVGPDDFTPETIRSTVDNLRSTFGGPTDPTPEPTATEPPLDDPRRQVFQEQGAVTQGIGDRVEEPPPPDRLEAGYADFNDARRRGTSVEDAAHHVLGALIGDVTEKGSSSVHAWEGWSEDARKREAAR